MIFIQFSCRNNNTKDDDNDKNDGNGDDDAQIDRNTEQYANI